MLPNEPNKPNKPDESIKPNTTRLFKSIEKVEKNGALFKHNVEKVSKIPRENESTENTNKFNNIWYLKYLDIENGRQSQSDKFNNAGIEVVIQELWRLFTGSPKYRFVYHNNRPAVISKNVEGGRILTSKDLELIFHLVNEKKLKNFEANLILSLLFNEIDFKVENTFLVEEKEGNRFIKIDGDWALDSAKRNSYYSKLSYIISTRDILVLPRKLNYQAFNWLNIDREGILQQDPLLGKCTTNRDELFKMIFNIMLIPDDFIESFVTAYISDEKMAIKIIETILERKMQLIDSAMQITSFIDYTLSDKAKSTMKELITTIKNFKTIQKKSIFNESYVEKIEFEFNLIIDFPFKKTTTYKEVFELRCDSKERISEKLMKTIPETLSKIMSHYIELSGNKKKIKEGFNTNVMATEIQDIDELCIDYINSLRNVRFNDQLFNETMELFAVISERISNMMRPQCSDEEIDAYIAHGLIVTDKNDPHLYVLKNLYKILSMIIVEANEAQIKENPSLGQKKP